MSMHGGGGGALLGGTDTVPGARVVALGAQQHPALEACEAGLEGHPAIDLAGVRERARGERRGGVREGSKRARKKVI